MVGPSLVARSAGTAEAITTLQPLDRHADALTLVRSLFDHAVTFAWLAADPGPDRLRRFLRTDCRKRLQVDDDCRKIGIEVLTDEKRREFQTTIDSLPKDMPDLAERARLADEEWAGKIPGLTGPVTPTSFRAMYAFAYRHQSAFAHASVMGLNAVTVDLPDGRKRVQLEQRDPEMRGPFGLAVIILALALYVAAPALGWPDPAEINAVFELSCGSTS